MLDRLLICTLQLTVIGMICLSAAGSILIGYQGFLSILGRHPVGGAWLALSVALGTFSYQLCRHRHDLVDR